MHTLSESDSQNLSSRFTPLNSLEAYNFSENNLSRVEGKSSPFWFWDDFALSFGLNYWLREFPLSAVTYPFQLRCQSKAADVIILHNLPFLIMIKSSFFYNETQ